MNADLLAFNQHRPRLLSIAYRMLGSHSDAEDILQDAYLRWHHADIASIDNHEAWLVTVVTRLAIDKLRALKTERENYIGPWLPEPIVLDETDSPERVALLAGEISQAFLLLLERLAPEERAAFLLREIFDFDYDEIARVITKSETACRQIVHRAKERVQSQRPRFHVAPSAHRKLLERFVAALASGEKSELMDLFADDIRFYGDGGGKVISALRVLEGGERVARLYEAIMRRSSQAEVNGRVDFVNINGELGLLIYADGKLDSVYSFVTDGVHIHEIYAVRNPDKFGGIPSIHRS